MKKVSDGMKNRVIKTMTAMIQNSAAAGSEKKQRRGPDSDDSDRMQTKKTKKKGASSKAGSRESSKPPSHANSKLVGQGGPWYKPQRKLNSNGASECDPTSRQASADSRDVKTRLRNDELSESGATTQRDHSPDKTDRHMAKSSSRKFDAVNGAGVGQSGIKISAMPVQEGESTENLTELKNDSTAKDARNGADQSHHAALITKSK